MAERGFYAESKEQLDMNELDFRDMVSVDYDDLSIVSADGDSFTARWEGDIKGFPYTVVTIDEAGEIKYSEEKRQVELVDADKPSFSGVFSFDLTGPDHHGAEGCFIFTDPTGEKVHDAYSDLHRFIGEMPIWFDDMFGRRKLGFRIVNAVKVQWTDDQKLEYYLSLEDGVPEIAEVLVSALEESPAPEKSAGRQIISALGTVRSAQRMHYAEQRKYARHMEALKVEEEDFASFENVSLGDISIVHAEDREYVLMWAGDIEGYEHNKVFMDQAGAVHVGAENAPVSVK